MDLIQKRAARLPQLESSRLLSSASANDALMLNGAPSKSDELAQFHVGETVTSLQKVTLGPGCAEVLLYTTIMGGVGALLPLTSKEDLELMQALEHAGDVCMTGEYILAAIAVGPPTHAQHSDSEGRRR